MNRPLIKWIRMATKQNLVPRWMPQPIRWVARRLSKGLYRRYHLRSRKRAIAGRIANLDDAEAFLCSHAVPIDAPMILISQCQRSGGTLLSQLFDGHPQVCAYPQELKLNYPVLDSWPEVDPARGARWNFLKLFDLNFPHRVRRGFSKGNRNPRRHSFMLMSRLQYGVFAHLFETQKPKNARGVLDQFFTAFFGCWLNYQGDLRRKLLITAFAPRLAHHEAQVDRFFSDYPDGRLIQILRDPAGWFPSAKHHSGFSRREASMILNYWRVSAESMLHNRRRFGDKVIIVRFEDMVGKTEAFMRELAAVLRLVWDPILLVPTFNGEPMHANSSFSVERSGVIQAPLDRSAMLSAEERAMIEHDYAALYRQVLDVLTIKIENPQSLTAAKQRAAQPSIGMHP